MLTDEQIDQCEQRLKEKHRDYWALTDEFDLIATIRTLQQQNKQLIEEKEQLQKSFQQVNDDYSALINIMDRARRLAFLAAEEEDRPRFKMDANGNLTRIEDNI